MGSSLGRSRKRTRSPVQTMKYHARTLTKAVLGAVPGISSLMNTIYIYIDGTQISPALTQKIQALEFFMQDLNYMWLHPTTATD
ncbi:hypothetical protein M405DRAFT_819620 [Rhizopogon salebrosus TDB-379]|nr:hypothetical protein M405DRAFT_819620 [Rhizopogon salebrosus TDB-379]